MADYNDRLDADEFDGRVGDSSGDIVGRGCACDDFEDNWLFSCFWVVLVSTY